MKHDRAAGFRRPCPSATHRDFSGFVGQRCVSRELSAAEYKEAKKEEPNIPVLVMHFDGDW